VGPGYIVGGSKSAVKNTDDFVWRLVKDCIQLGLVPDINNTVDIVPVAYVAAPVGAAFVAALPITAAPALNRLLSAFARYGT
jgi:L-aminoadipate-semialdehyde dehydrogenase